MVTISWSGNYKQKETDFQSAKNVFWYDFWAMILLFLNTDGDGSVRKKPQMQCYNV